MAYKPQNTVMLFTDGIEDHGVSKGVQWHALVWEFDVELGLGRWKWHYFGTTMPSPLPYLSEFPTATGMQHPDTLFPPALNDLPEGDTALYDLAKEIEFNILSLEDYKPQNCVMLFTDGIDENGVAHDVSWHALVWEYSASLSHGRYRWHYFGTTMPSPLPYLEFFPDADGMQHPVTHFPSALNDLPEGDQGLYALAMSVEYYRLSL